MEINNLTIETLSTIVNLWKKISGSANELEASMANLYRVTDETDRTYERFLSNASQKAQELGRSVSSLVEQTASWARLGQSLEDASKLAEISSLYANISGLSDNAAVLQLSEAMSAFNLEATDSLSLVGSLHKLGSEFTTDSASLGEGLINSASALNLAGNDIHQTLAMLTGGTEFTSDASEMGSALAVTSLRIQGMTESLAELGAEYENVGSASQIQAQILEQTNGAVDTFSDTGDLRSTYDILLDISEVWNQLSQSNQGALLETLGGSQYEEQISALIQSFQSGEVEKALGVSMQSGNFALQEQAQILDSFTAKTQQFDAAFQSLSTSVLDSSLVKGFVDFGTRAINVLTAVIDKIGVLSTAGLAIGAEFGLKNVGILKCGESKYHCFAIPTV